MKGNYKLQLKVGDNVSNWVSESRFLEEEKARLDTQDQLAIAEETVEVLEGLLEKVATELLIVKGVNARLVGHTLKNTSPVAPAAPPYIPGIQPWTCPDKPQDNNPVPWTFLGVCQRRDDKPMVDVTDKSLNEYMEHASKVVAAWSAWKRHGSDTTRILNGGGNF